MKKNEVYLLCLLFLFAFSLRCYDFSYPSFRWADENAHVPAATNYIENGQFEPDFWEHPPLRHLILYGFLQIFGDNPYGWRMRNILFGAAAVVLTYLFARKISGSRNVALMAALLLSSDPLHIVLSRYTFEEVYGGAVFLAAVILFLMHEKRSSVLVLSAFVMGCALAIKWYYVPCWLLLFGLLLRDDENYRQPGLVLFFTVTYILIPLTVFIASYYQWFGRGYSFPEFLDFITSAYYSLQKYTPKNFQAGMIFLSHPSSLEWFFKPVIVGQGTYLEGDRGEFILYMNNLPIWILVVPSMIATTVLAIRDKSLALAIPVLLFCGSYLLFLTVKRPVFIYSAATLLPFAFTALAVVTARVADRFGARFYYCMLAIMLAWNLYLYPFATAKKVPIAPYRYLLEKADIVLQ